MEQKNTTKRNFVVQIDDTLQQDLNDIKETSGINWSFEVRKFLMQRTQELKQVHALN